MAGRKRFMQNFKLMLVYKKTLIYSSTSGKQRVLWLRDYTNNKTNSFHRCQFIDERQYSKRGTACAASSLMNVKTVKEELCCQFIDERQNSER